MLETVITLRVKGCLSLGLECVKSQAAEEREQKT